MSSKIGFFSDPHASPRTVAAAVSALRARGVTRMLCGGDIAGYGSTLSETVDLLQSAGCESLVGNLDLWYLGRHRSALPSCDRYFEGLPAFRA